MTCKDCKNLECECKKSIPITAFFGDVPKSERQRIAKLIWEKS